MDIFDLFETTSYTFLRLQPVAGGNKVVSEVVTTGIVKHRDGMVQEGGREAYTAQTTLKIRPEEPFIEAVGGHQKLVGHGIRLDGTDYRIDGETVARDYDTGSIDFYRVTLKRASTWQSALPLD